MATSVATMAVSKSRKIGFYAAVVISLAVVVGGLADVLVFGIIGWMSAATLEEVFPAGDLHRIHGLSHALVGWILALSVSVQLWRPKKRLAAALLAFVGLLIYTITVVVSGLFDGLEVVGIAAMGVMTWLHPGRDVMTLAPFKQRSLLFASPLMVAGVALAAVQLSRQLSAAADPHSAIGHYGTMAALALIVVAAFSIGSSALAGSRFVAGLGTGGAVLLGLASVLFPDYSSSLGVAFGAVVVLAALLYGWATVSDRRPAAVGVSRVVG
jgi:hypothetical protein